MSEFVGWFFAKLFSATSCRATLRNETAMGSNEQTGGRLHFTGFVTLFEPFRGDGYRGSESTVSVLK